MTALHERSAVDRMIGGDESVCRALFDSVPDATLVADGAGTIVHATARVEAVLGYRPADLLGRPVDSVVSTDRHGSVARTAGGSDIAVDIARRTVDTACGPLMVASLRDVTARRRAERAAELLQAVTSVVAVADEFVVAVLRTLEVACDAIGAVYAETWLPGADGAPLTVAEAAFARTPDLLRLHQAASGIRFDRGVGIQGAVWSSGVPRWTDDVRDERMFARRATARELGLGAALTVPVVSAGDVLAVMLFLFDRPAAPDEELVASLAAASSALAPALLRRRDRDELRAAEARVAAAFEGAAHGMAMLDANGCVTAVNPAFCGAVSRREADVCGLAWAELFVGEDAAGVRGVVDAVLAGGHLQAAGESACVIGGGLRWLHVTASAVAGPHGPRSHCFVHVQDVTDRKEAELAVQRQAELLDLAHDAVIVRDLDNRVVFWNRGAESTYGWSAAEATGASCSTLFDTDARSAVEIAEHVSSEGLWQRELEHRTKRGDRIVVESRVALRLGADGAVTGYLEVNRDITARTDAERALREAERRVDQILAELPVGVYVSDTSGTPVYANDVAVTIFGHGAEAAGAQLPLARALEGETTTAELDVARAGRAVPVRMRALPLRDGAGAITYALAVVEDVTAERDAAAALAKHIDELARSNRDLEQFAYITSHDLSEPLRSVVGFSQLLAEEIGDSLGEAPKEFLGYIVESTSRMQSLIGDLLAYSRAARADMPVGSVPLGDVVARACLSLGSTVASTRAVVTIDDLPEVAGNARQLEQLFQNLLANALKFRRPGVAPVVHVGAERRPGHWEISVTDNGIGIEPRHRERVFQMFQRLHTRDEYEGTGIGLALCKKAVERHGGTISIDGAPGGGCRLVFTIADGSER